MQSVVVTGVSTGIGRGTAEVLLRKGFRVFGSVRKREDAEKARAELGPMFSPLVFDVTDERAVREAARAVADELAGERLFGLVNNAGVALPAPLIYQPIREFRDQIEVNLIGPLIVTQAFVGLLKAPGVSEAAKRGGGRGDTSSRAGRIVNVGSIGGAIAGPFIGAYHASKFGLEGFSTSLRRELMLFGIDVIVVGPGGVRTPIWKKANELDLGPYAKTEYAPALGPFRDYMTRTGLTGYAPERIGTVIVKALTAKRPLTRYGFAVVPHPIGSWIIPRLLPARMTDRIIAKSLGWR